MMGTFISRMDNRAGAAALGCRITVATTALPPAANTGDAAAPGVCYTFLRNTPALLFRGRIW